jgi:hypothetical protein
MSGPSDLARLSDTIDKANELLLSDQIKMMDVGDGVMRPTNAKVLGDLAAQMSGALIYTSVALGLAGTLANGYFSVLSVTAAGYIDLYQNVSGAAVFRKSYPSAEKVDEVDATGQANAAAVESLSGLVQASAEKLDEVDTVGQANAAAVDTLNDLAFPRSLAVDMPWAVVDQFMQPILGVKDNGVAHALLDTMPGLPVLSNYAWAIVDAANVVLLGVTWAGEVVAYGQSSAGVSAYADGPIGAQDIFALIDGAPFQLTSTGDNFSPLISSGQATYLHREGSVSRITQDLPGVGSFASFITKMLHFPGSGQSLMMGDKTVPTTLQAPTANRLFTLQDGVQLTVQTATLTPAMVAPFKPLMAKALESPIVQMSAQVNRLRGLPSNAGVLTSCHGRNGQAIALLSKGTIYYNNLLTAVGAAKAECDSKGYDYEVPFVHWIQGEANNSDAAGLYTTALLQLQSDYQTDIKALSGQASGVPMLLDQISNWTAYNSTQSYVPLEQLEASLKYPDRFVCAGPKYWLATDADGIHLTTTSSMRAGAMHARPAMAIINGEKWLPTHAVSAVRFGAKVLVEFHTPFGPLVVDTKNVTDPGSWGLRYVDDSGVRAISSVRNAGSNRIEITLTSIPAGSNPYVGIADVGVSGAPGGPTSGARSCLRDSSPDRDAYGQPVFNWACHQRISVTN